MKILYFLATITILFIIYIEFSVGSILLRPNSLGKISINLYSLFGFLMNPFYKRDLWNWSTLDINYAFVIIYSLFIYYIF